MPTLYIFSGGDLYFAITPVAQGTNLPAEHGPWTQIRTIDSNDPRLKQGADKGTLEEIREKGYSIRRFVVTFEPSTTVPSTP